MLLLLDFAALCGLPGEHTLDDELIDKQQRRAPLLLIAEQLRAPPACSRLAADSQEEPTRWDHAIDVDVELPPRDVVALLEERPDRHDPGVVDRDIDRALRRLDGVEEGWNDSRSVTSRGRPTAPNRAAVASTAATSTSPSVTRAPPRRNRSAVTAPIPRPPPVIATCSRCRRIGSVIDRSYPRAVSGSVPVAPRRVGMLDAP